MNDVRRPVHPEGELWGHRWGFKDTRFVINEDGSVSLTGDRYPLCGYRMYDLLPYVEEVLGLVLLSGAALLLQG